MRFWNAASQNDGCILKRGNAEYVNARWIVEGALFYATVVATGARVYQITYYVSTINHESDNKDYGHASFFKQNRVAVSAFNYLI